jgi:porphobilinogen synthase
VEASRWAPDTTELREGSAGLSARPRRLRRLANLRRLVRETRLVIDNLIYPLFVVHDGPKEEIPSMPGIHRWPVELLPAEAEEVAGLDIPAVILFGLPAAKDAQGSEAYAADGVVQRAVRAIKAAVPELVVMTDVCLCEYTDHGHCGIVRDGQVLNDETLDVLGRVAVSHAVAGADVVAPSAMMDGQVGAIRAALDEAGFPQVAILAYAAKYASAFYGPFRDAADSAPAFGDRRGYQMDPPNTREALREVALDIQEGADMVMVKPALAYLDVIRQVRDAFDCPLAAYNVSGEYSLVKAATQRGWIDERAAVLETLTAIRRAGADMILTYFAKDAVRWLREGG